MLNRIELKDMLLEAITNLQATGHEQVTQAEIAQQLGVRSKKLNKSRQDALDELVMAGQLHRTIKEDDARNIRLYSLTDDDDTAPGTPVKPPPKQLPGQERGLYEDRFYTALFAYLDHHADFSKSMQYVPDNLSADEWLVKAKQHAEVLRREYGISKDTEIVQMLEWVKRGDFDAAWAHIRAQGERVDADIKAARTD